jgi:hypothetical protein
MRYDSTKNASNSMNDDWGHYEPDEEFSRTWEEIHDRKNESLDQGASINFESNGNIAIQEPQIKQNKKSGRRAQNKSHKLLIKLTAAVLTLSVLYCVAVFSNIPFIEKWRNLY